MQEVANRKLNCSDFIYFEDKLKLISNNIKINIK